MSGETSRGPISSFLQSTLGTSRVRRQGEGSLHKIALSQGNTASNKKFAQSGGHVGMAAPGQLCNIMDIGLRLSQRTHRTELATFTVTTLSS